jgi:hypothetical protein
MQLYNTSIFLISIKAPRTAFIELTSPSILKSRGASRLDIIGRLVDAGGYQALTSAFYTYFSYYKII